MPTRNIGPCACCKDMPVSFRILRVGGVFNVMKVTIYTPDPAAGFNTTWTSDGGTGVTDELGFTNIEIEATYQSGDKKVLTLYNYNNYYQSSWGGVALTGQVRLENLRKDWKLEWTWSDDLCEMNQSKNLLVGGVMNYGGTDRSSIVWSFD